MCLTACEESHWLTSVRNAVLDAEVVLPASPLCSLEQVYASVAFTHISLASSR